jgi:hypothetical protein
MTIVKGFIPNRRQLIIGQFESIGASVSPIQGQNLPNRRVLKRFGSYNLGEKLAANPTLLRDQLAEAKAVEKCPHQQRKVPF